MSGVANLFTVKALAIVMLASSLLGAVDAAYLAYMGYLQSPLSCGVLSGCNEVAQSPYSKVFGVPLSVFGVLFYATVFLAVGAYLAFRRDFLKNALLFLVSVGFLFSLYFLYLQGFVIKAFCIYCLFSALMSGVLFAAGLCLRRV